MIESKTKKLAPFSDANLLSGDNLMAEPTGFEPATSDVTGQSVSSHFQAVAFTVSKLERLVPTLGVTE